jgi:hypothetical protein
METSRDKFLKRMNVTAAALAADRATKFLPIVVAQGFFVGAIAVAILKIISTTSNPSIFINVEAHSIAFSALYFWIIPTVCLTSVIGVSQTEGAIPRILKRFQEEFNYELNEQSTSPAGDIVDQARARVANGGVYSWLPAKPEKDEDGAQVKDVTQDKSWPFLSFVKSDGPAILIVVLGTLTALLISGFVPPQGWEPRHCAQASFLAVWFISFGVTCWAKHLPLRLAFWLTFTKDLLVTLGNVGGIIVTQIGIFHRCDSYTRWNRTGLKLPAMPEVAATLEDHMRVNYLAITFTSIGIHVLIFMLIITCKYKHARQVFLQRDDESASARRFGWGGWLRAPSQGRSPTINREHGMPPDIALQPLLPDGRQVQEPDHRDESTDSRNTTHAQETWRPVIAGPSGMTSARHDAADDRTHFVVRKRPTG